MSNPFNAAVTVVGMKTTHNDSSFDAHVNVVVQPDHNFLPLQQYDVVSFNPCITEVPAHLLQVLEDDVLMVSAQEKDGHSLLSVLRMSYSRWAEPSRVVAVLT